MERLVTSRGIARNLLKRRLATSVKSRVTLLATVLKIRVTARATMTIARPTPATVTTAIRATATRASATRAASSATSRATAMTTAATATGTIPWLLFFCYLESSTIIVYEMFFSVDVVGRVTGRATAIRRTLASEIATPTSSATTARVSATSPHDVLRPKTARTARPAFTTALRRTMQLDFVEKLGDLGGDEAYC